MALIAWTTGFRFWMLRIGCIVVGIALGTLLMPYLR